MIRTQTMAGTRPTWITGNLRRLSNYRSPRGWLTTARGLRETFAKDAARHLKISLKVFMKYVEWQLDVGAMGCDARSVMPPISKSLLMLDT